MCWNRDVRSYPLKQGSKVGAIDDDSESARNPAAGSSEKVVLNL